MTFVSNEEYRERWEQAAPKLVEPTEAELDLMRQKVQAQQAAVKTSWWGDYDAEITPEQDPALVEAMAEYAGRVSDAEASSQTKEELARQKEISEDVAAEYRWLSPEEYKDEHERIGSIMHSSVFITLLQKAGVNCWYRNHPQPGKVTLIVQRLGLEPEVACWCQQGYAPELSVMRFDEHGVPLAEKYRGWRTSLLQLILKGIIKEKVANKVFGAPKTTPAFARYNLTLQHFRNQGNRLDD